MLVTWLSDGKFDVKHVAGTTQQTVDGKNRPANLMGLAALPSDSRSEEGHGSGSGGLNRGDVSG
jgi:hypothetical protein